MFRAAFVHYASLPLTDGRRHRRRLLCQRQARFRVAAKLSDGPSNDASEEWLEMSRKLSQEPSEHESIRKDPQWEYPEGTEFSTPPTISSTSEPGTAALSEDGILEKPWETWRSALEKEQEISGEPVSRDPEAETDFWRASARELVPDAPESTQVADISDDALKSIRDDESMERQDPRLETSANVWAAAAAVTGAVVDMQETLRSELDSFDPASGTDNYREIARDLGASPSSMEPPERSERPEIQDQKIESTASAEAAASAGSGWNPDVDWKRYDDINRTTQLERDKANRAKMQSDAESARREYIEAHGSAGGTAAPVSFAYTDQDGNPLTQEQVDDALAEGAVFVDENGKEVDPPTLEDTIGSAMQPPSSQTPTKAPETAGRGQPSFIGGVGGLPRMQNASTYGAGASGIEKNMQELAELGVPLRDPEADKEFWRDAAKEISITSPVDVAPSVDSTELPQEEDAPKQEAVEETVSRKPDIVDDARAGKAATEVDGSTAGDNALERILSPDPDETPIEESGAWANWNSGISSWQKSVENAPERDLKAEVDMWKGTARSLVDEQSSSVVTDRSSDAEDLAPAVEDNPWSAWNTANAAWNTMVEGTVLDSPDPANMWRNSGRGQSQPLTEGSANVPSDGHGMRGQGTWSGDVVTGAPREEGSAWSTWQRSGRGSVAKGMSDFAESPTAGGQSSGENRIAGRRRDIASTNVSVWLSSARDLNPETSKNPTDHGSGAADSETANSSEDGFSNVDPWRNAARDLTVDE